MTRILVALIALVALGSLTWFALGGDEGADGPTGGAAAVPVAGSEPAEADPAAVDPVDAEPVDAEPAPTPASPTPVPTANLTETTREADRTAVEPEGTPITIAVVDERGAPRAGAEVVVLDRALYDRRALRDARRAAKEPAAEDGVLRDFGLVLITDANGLAVHRWSEERTEVHVLRPARVPRALMKRHEGGRLTIVCPDPPLVVEVLDSLGEPVVGVPVFVGGAEMGEGIGFIQVMLGTFDRTGADGTCAPTAAAAAMNLLAGGGESTLVELGVLLEAGTRRTVRPVEGESQTATYLLPPTASVRVRVLDPAGEPVADGGAGVILRTRPEAVVAADTPPSVAAVLEGGEVHFPWVEPGLLLFGEVNSAGAEWSAEFERAGPVRAGEELVIEVIGERNPGTRMRVLLEEHGPLAETSLQVNQEAGYSTVFMRMRTDADGYLTVADRDTGSWSSATEPVTLRVRYERGSRAYEGSIELPEIEADEFIELDDLTLVEVEVTSTAVVASGTVVDRVGEPVEGVVVKLVDPEPIEVGGAGEEAGDNRRWTSLGGSDGTDGRGRFAVRGLPDLAERPIALRVEGEVIAAHEPVRVDFGAEDLRIAVDRLGEATVELVGFEDCFDQPRVWLQFEEVGDEQSSHQRRRAALGDSWTQPLAGGVYDLLVSCDGRAEPLVTVDDLIVPDGRPCEDPRLLAIDLRHHWQRGRLSVSDENGEPLVAFYSFKGDASKGQGFSGADGTADFFGLADEPLSLFVGAEGYVPRTVSNHLGDLSLELSTGGEIRVALDGLPAAINPRKFAVHLRLEADSDLVAADSGSLSSAAALGADGIAALDTCGPGRYRASVLVPEEVAAELGEAWLKAQGSADLGTIVVDSTSADALFRLTLPELSLGD